MNRPIGGRPASVLLAVILVLACGLAACGPKGESPEAKRKYVRDMRADTLKELFEMRPAVRAKLERAVGYGVFSNLETKIMVVGGGSGYGIVVDNRSGKETFMRMAKVHGGFGMGIQDFRAVFVFNDRATMTKFIEEGWQFGGGADASAKAGDKGVAATGDVALDTTGAPMEIYQFTKAGIALSATAAGTKYWKDKTLN
ncbi:MAG TPA: YSC84-related protein [Myxococcota bacterium]